jgi:hypothetical protein
LMRPRMMSRATSHRMVDLGRVNQMRVFGRDSVPRRGGRGGRRDDTLIQTLEYWQASSLFPHGVSSRAPGRSRPSCCVKETRSE